MYNGAKNSVALRAPSSEIVGPERKPGGHRQFPSLDYGGTAMKLCIGYEKKITEDSAVIGII